MKMALGLVALLGVGTGPCRAAPAGDQVRAASPERASLDTQDWSTYHGNYALEGVSESAPPDAPGRLWRFKVEGRVHATPVAGGGKVHFATDKGMVVALDLEGKEVWKVELAKENFKAPLLLTERVLVLGSEEGNLYALDAGTGKPKWTYKMGGVIQGSANRVDLRGGKKAVIVVSQSDGSIHCVDLEGGTLAWKTDPIDRSDGSPGVRDGRILLGSCASALHVFSVDKEGKTADIEIGGDCQVAGGVAISGTLAFAGTRSGKVVAVDVTAGKLVWTNEDCKKEVFTTPAVNAKVVVFGAEDGMVYALDRATGRKLWDFDTGKTPSSPVIAGERVVVSAGGALTMLELGTGKKLWSTPVSDEISSPALVGGRMIVGADDGTVSCYGRK